MAQEELHKLRIDKTAAGARPPRSRRPWLRYGLALAVLAGAAAAYLQAFPPRPTVEAAQVIQVYPTQAYTALSASGYVVAQRKAAVAAKTTSRLVWLGVEEGSRVREGEIIARLEGDDVEAARRQAAANLLSAQAGLASARAELHDAALNFSRQTELFRQRLVAKADYDAAEARHLKAQAAVASAGAAIAASQAALRAAEVSIEYTLIRAPFDGVVLTKNADVGDIVTPLGAAANAKASVVTMADMASLVVEADVSESSLALVAVRQPTEIQLDALPGMRFPGRVHMIVPTADRSKASVLVKVAFQALDPRILPEMSAKVAFLEHPQAPGDDRPRTVLGPAAVVERDGRTIVYVLADGTVRARPVTLGERIGDQVEVLDGVASGDKVVVGPPAVLAGLKDGDRVAVAGK